MAERDDAIGKVWQWLKQNIPSDSTPPFGITGQRIGGHRDPGIVDALWQLASAGILRIDGDPQFTFTESGRVAVQADISPYDQPRYLKALDATSPSL